MPRRATTTRKRPYRRRYVRRKRATRYVRITRLARSPQKIHYHVLQGTSPIYNVTFGQGHCWNWQCNIAPNVAEFSALYDQYRVISLTHTYFPIYNSADMSGATTKALFPIAWYIDYDDATPPTSMTQMLERQDLKYTRDGKTIKIGPYVPRVNTAAYPNPAAFIASPVSIKPPWLDCTSMDVKHYGVKVWLDDNGTPNGTQCGVLLTRAVVAFKGAQ